MKNIETKKPATGQDGRDPFNSGGPWRPGALPVALAVAAMIGSLMLATTYRVDATTTPDGTINAIGQARQALEVRDYSLARSLLTPLAAEGNKEAEVDLGSMSEFGEGTPKSIEGAVGWYLKAANSGDVEAASRVGGIYLRGVGVAQDFTKAYHWLDIAANEGNVDAQLRLGRLYEHGWGVARDPVVAYSWYATAARQDRHQAIAARDRILASLTPDEVAAGQAALRRLAPDTARPAVPNSVAPSPVAPSSATPSLATPST